MSSVSTFHIKFRYGNASGSDLRSKHRSWINDRRCPDHQTKVAIVEILLCETRDL